MNKLTAGIFAGILAVVSVNAAHADIATTTYVQGGVQVAKSYTDTKVGDLTELTTTAKTNAVAAINEVKTTAAAAVAQALTDAKAHTDALANGAVKTNTDAIAVLNGDENTAGSVKKIATEIAAAKLEGTATAVGELEKTVGKINEDIEALNDSIEDSIIEVKGITDGLDGRLTTAEGKITTLNGGEDVAGSVANALKQAKAYTDSKDTAMNTRVTATESAIDTLNGTGEGSVQQKINTAIATVNANATELEGKVTANTNAIATLNGEGAGSVKKAAADALADANSYTDTEIGKVTTAATALTTRVTTAEGKITTLTGAANVDGSVANAKKAGTDAAAALETYKTEQAGTDSAQNTNITANTNAIATLNGDGAGSVKKAAADALADAKSYTDGKVTTINTAIDGKMNINKDLANKVVTTDATTGQLKDASDGVPKPSECNNAGVKCMLINDGTGFKWEKIVDTFTE